MKFCSLPSLKSKLMQLLYVHVLFLSDLQYENEAFIGKWTPLSRKLTIPHFSDATGKVHVHVNTYNFLSHCMCIYDT